MVRGKFSMKNIRISLGAYKIEYISRYGIRKNAEWGAGIVRQLSEFIRTQDPTIKGWSYRTIYKMVQFYDTYSTVSFCQLLETTKLPKLFTNKNSDKNSQFVPIQLAQIPYVLFSTGWSNHQLILNRCKSAEERLFYIIYSKFEHLEYKQLEQAIKTDTMASILSLPSFLIIPVIFITAKSFLRS